jgi:hypothetical protein
MSKYNEETKLWEGTPSPVHEREFDAEKGVWRTTSEWDHLNDRWVHKEPKVEKKVSKKKAKKKK